MDGTYYRRGFGLKSEIEGQLTDDYHSTVVETLRNGGYRLTVGPLTFRLAREFGFCYGVDRAVEYAYETRRKFPDRRLFLVGEIIHNPHVNQKLRDMGITFLLPDGDRRIRFLGHRTGGCGDPPGVRRHDAATSIDCGRSGACWWTRPAARCSMSGSASRATRETDSPPSSTASTTTRRPRRPRARSPSTPAGRYLVLLNMDEARTVCDFIERGGDAAALNARFAKASFPGFDFTTDLERVGIANQTTMLSGESLAIAEEIRRSIERRYGAEALGDALPVIRHDLLRHAGASGRGTRVARRATRRDGGRRRIQLEQHLPSGRARASREGARPSTFRTRIASRWTREPIRHQPIGTKRESRDRGLAPAAGSIGITAGASTPNNKIGETLVRICELAGVAGELRALTG